MDESPPDVPVTREEIDAESTAFINSIILWRIYDVLVLLLGAQSPASAKSITKLHEEGGFLGPNPAYRPAEPDEPGE